MAAVRKLALIQAYMFENIGSVTVNKKYVTIKNPISIIDAGTTRNIFEDCSICQKNGVVKTIIGNSKKAKQQVTLKILFISVLKLRAKNSIPLTMDGQNTRAK